MERKGSKVSKIVKTRSGAHFDEKNLRETNPMRKDYGLMFTKESNTPYPRQGEPVDASQLRERLMAANKGSVFSMSYMPSDIELSQGEISPSTLSVDSKETDESFDTKRKRFHASEFLIAKQRLMSDEIHLPGEGVAGSTRHSELYSPFEGRRFTR